MYKKAIYFRVYCLKASMKTSPHFSNVTRLPSSWVEKGADSIYMNFRSVTYLLHRWTPKDREAKQACIGKKKKIKNGERERNEKIFKKIYYEAKLLSKVFSQHMCTRNPTSSLLKNIFVTYFFKIANLLFCSTFLDFYNQL